MLILIWLALCLVAVALILLPSAIWLRQILSKFTGGRTVVCPENRQTAAVNLDIGYAALTGMHGRPVPRVCDCTRWPERAQCTQGCLHQAVNTEPFASGKTRVKTKQIYHLPVLLAAGVAWYLGMIWHSQYLFRAQWADAAGLTREQVKQVVAGFAPHLLAVGALLLFAYGVAWLLAVRHRKGVLQGVWMAGLLGGGLAVVSAHSMAGLPRDLLVMEAGNWRWR